jgi:hypothetical protein
VQRNNLRHLHNTWSNCPSLVSLDRHGAELKPTLTVSGSLFLLVDCRLSLAACEDVVHFLRLGFVVHIECAASRGSRLGVVRAGGCPFGFKSPIGRGGRELSVETNVAATANLPVNNLDAPAPSSDAPDSINLRLGSISLPCALTVGWIASLLSSWESLRVSIVYESSCFPWWLSLFFLELFFWVN